MKPRSIWVVLALLLALSIAQAGPDVVTDRSLETGLAEAMGLRKDRTGRVGDSGKAIQAYMARGIVNKRPNGRIDYTDYYLVNRPAYFFGQKLVLIEEEYMGKFIGCCVNDGLQVTVLLSGDTSPLEEFADANGCTLSTSMGEYADPNAVLSMLGLKARLPKGKYAYLNCRYSEIDRH